LLKRVGAYWHRNPTRAVPSGRCSNVAIPEGTKRRPIDTLRCTRSLAFGQMCSEARERRPKGTSVKAFAGRPSKGETPGEHPAVGVLIARPGARDSRKGQNPGTAAWRAGSSPRRREYRHVKRYVGACGRKRSPTFREGNASKGKSHERCRYETRPTGVRRE